ncbi:MAG: protease [Bacteriovoracaceae bacterium]|nr:protease [Bacteriovoracaceae bacterium]
MKQPNKKLKFRLINSLTLILLTVIVACKPAQKDPELNFNHNRLDAKVDGLKIEAENPLTKMGVTDLWKKTTGKSADGNRVTIALVGTGIDYTIPDLRDALWINMGEYSEQNRNNGVDDDGNGYVDDVIGYDFFSGDARPYDWNGHDTFTASIIAATGRENSKIVGVAPNAQIMIARYIGPNGSGKGLDAVEAVTYAINNKAKIIYFNWPEGGFNAMETPLVVAAFKAAGEKNILVVTPAGNSGNHAVPAFIQLAARLPNVVVVAGLDQTGKIKATSNSGRNLALTAAPSVGAFGYLPGGSISQDIQTTSVAAAYVTGAAALLSTLPEMTSVQKLKAALLAASGSRKANAELIDVLSGGALDLAGL